MTRTTVVALAILAGCSHTVRTTAPRVDGPPSASAASVCMALPDPTDCLRRTPGATVEPDRSCPAAAGRICVERREPDHAKTGLVLALAAVVAVVGVALALDFQNTLEHSGD